MPTLDAEFMPFMVANKATGPVHVRNALLVRVLREHLNNIRNAIPEYNETFREDYTEFLSKLISRVDILYQAVILQLGV